VGDEIQKTRNAVVISVDSVGRLALRTVVPITGWDSKYSQWPWMVPLTPTGQNGLTKISAADAFQVKSVSVERFQNRLGVLRSYKVKEVAAAVALCAGYEP